MGTENHLCASHVIESAASMPARCPLRLGEMTAAPPHAASTWNHSPCERQKRARSGNGSIAPAAVVPAVPTTMKGDRKSTRLNSSHSQISYAVFCLKKKKNQPRLFHD